MKMRPEHKPFGDPCAICHQPALNHRVAHESVGNPCDKCGLPAENHYVKTAEQRAKENQTFRTTEAGKEAQKRAVDNYKLNNPEKFKDYKSREQRKAEKKARIEDDLPEYAKETLYVGVDGEGQGRVQHAYVFLGASNIDGSKTWSVEDLSWRKSWNPNHQSKEYPQGRYEGYVRTLPTVACADFLLALPKRAKTFSFAFGYDMTKIIEEVEDKKIYSLVRPETRPNTNPKKKFLGPKEVKPWRKKEYRLNLQGTKFTIRKGPTKRIVWDIFKFYGSKFVSALKDWKVGNPDLWKRMTKMKDKRGEFDKEPPDDVEVYCLEECMCMAQLAKKLDDAHIQVGLPLKSIGYYGAGSSASAMLKSMKILEQIRPLPPEMQEAITMAFFGGRFELSEIGEILEDTYNRDISSAYPYQIFFLPCLVHGTWKLTKRREDIDGKIALVNYGLDEKYSKLDDVCSHWGPFPFRTNKGEICFPATSGGGWIYQAEFLAGEKLFPHVYFKKAWVYEKNCDCQPFEKIGHYYLFRLFLGKEGPGLVIKLAVNSCYGKLAQSLGHAKFNCWLWAGMITSGCRGQLLTLMGQAPHLSDILMVATDGIASRKWLPFPAPKDTGTGFLLGLDGKTIDKSKPNPKPLGGWEAPMEDDKVTEKVNRRGLFLARPGIYFPMNPSEEDIKEIKGRGIGRGTIIDSHEKIVSSWRKYGMTKTIQVANVSRFCGAKTSISRAGSPGKWMYTRADGSKGPDMPNYGNWVAKTIEMSFNPEPKREGVAKNGKSLVVRRLPKDVMSMPYKKAIAEKTKEAKELKKAEMIMLEQPDIDFSEFGDFVSD